LLARDDLEHAIIAAIAGSRNDVGIDQAGRHLEFSRAWLRVEKTPSS